MTRESTSQTLTVALMLCGVCSFLVSASAVGLRAKQQENKALDKQKNVLAVAGLLNGESKTEIEAAFEQIETVLIDLKSGEAVEKVGKMPAAEFDARAAVSSPRLSINVPAEKDVASIKKRAKYSFVYIVKKEGKIDQIVLPIHGMGLWSILYGFVALDADTKGIRGIGYYEHAETPGLGGEVDNPIWKAKWTNGKQAFDDDGNIRIEVVKGEVNSSTPDAEFKVDGLSGATFTSNGVTYMLQYWLGDHAFGPLLERVRDGEFAEPQAESE
ncbi:MAG: Na(+)-translocating NADH-quinone reductase subunit C [Planctomycetaceae bacterium]|nr:Na(+)-translocating NADH-quinone reductase subunit C [Planctomycetaceae bacterium]